MKIASASTEAMPADFFDEKKVPFSREEESRLHDACHKQKMQPVFEYMSRPLPKAIKDFTGIIEQLDRTLDDY